MQSSYKQNVWNRRAVRYIRRGKSGIGRSVILAEWSAAAKLWEEYIAPVNGWTIDFGAGNGGFWELINPPCDLVWLDITSNYPPSQKYRGRIVADALNPPIEPETQSCIVALGLLEYIPDIGKLLRIWRSLAVAGGKLLISNSPPIFPNYIRRFIYKDVLPRSDGEIKAALISAKWGILPGSQVRVGWQTLYVAIAV